MNKTKKRRKTQRRRRKMTGGIIGILKDIFGKLKEKKEDVSYIDGVSGEWELRRIRLVHEILNDPELQQGLVNMECMFITKDTIYNLTRGPVPKLSIDTKEYISTDGDPVTEHNDVFLLYFNGTIVGYMSCRVFICENKDKRLCYVKYECCNMRVALESIDQDSGIYPDQKASVIMQAFLIEYMRMKHDVTHIYKQLLTIYEDTPYLYVLKYSLKSGFLYNPDRVLGDEDNLKYLGIIGGNYSTFDITNMRHPPPLSLPQLDLIRRTLIRSIRYSDGFQESLLKKHFRVFDPEKHYTEEYKTLVINEYVDRIMASYDYQAQVSEMFIATRLLNINVGTAPPTIVQDVSRKPIKQGLSVLEGRKKREADAEEKRSDDRRERMILTRKQRRQPPEEGVRGNHRFPL